MFDMRQSWRIPSGSGKQGVTLVHLKLLIHQLWQNTMGALTLRALSPQRMVMDITT